MSYVRISHDLCTYLAFCRKSLIPLKRCGRENADITLSSLCQKLPHNNDSTGLSCQTWFSQEQKYSFDVTVGDKLCSKVTLTSWIFTGKTLLLFKWCNLYLFVPHSRWMLKNDTFLILRAVKKSSNFAAITIWNIHNCLTEKHWRLKDNFLPKISNCCKSKHAFCFVTFSARIQSLTTISHSETQRFCSWSLSINTAHMPTALTLNLPLATCWLPMGFVFCLHITFLLPTEGRPLFSAKLSRIILTRVENSYWFWTTNLFFEHSTFQTQAMLSILSRCLRIQALTTNTQFYL